MSYTESDILAAAEATPAAEAKALKKKEALTKLIENVSQSFESSTKDEKKKKEDVMSADPVMVKNMVDKLKPDAKFIGLKNKLSDLSKAFIIQRAQFEGEPFIRKRDKGEIFQRAQNLLKELQSKQRTNKKEIEDAEKAVAIAESESEIAIKEYKEIEVEKKRLEDEMHQTNLDILSHIISQSDYYSIHSDDKYPEKITQQSTEPLIKDRTALLSEFKFLGPHLRHNVIKHFMFPQIIEFIRFLYSLRAVCNELGFITIKDDIFAFHNFAMNVPILQFFIKKNSVIYDILDRICYEETPDTIIKQYQYIGTVYTKVQELCKEIKGKFPIRPTISDINIVLNKEILTLRGEQFSLIESISTRSFIESQAGGGDSSGYKNSKLKKYHIRRIHRIHRTRKINKKYTRKHVRKTHHKRVSKNHKRKHNSRSRKHKKHTRR